MAFFTERNAESVDAFVASIVRYGFGTGGEEEDIKLLLRLMQVLFLISPPSTDPV